MKSRQLMFFALFEDLEPLVKDIENRLDIQYFKSGMHESENIIQYNSIYEIPNAGFTSSGDWNKIDSYLVVKKNTLLNIREIQQKTGAIKFAVDQMINPNSIEIKLGGIYTEKENVIVAGRVATISNDDDSDELYKVFTKLFKKEFKKNGFFYVGKFAQEGLQKGWRLVTNEKLSKEFDLIIQ